MLNHEFAINVVRAAAVAVLSLITGMISGALMAAFAAHSGWNGELVFRLGYLLVTPLACYTLWRQETA